MKEIVIASVLLIVLLCGIALNNRFINDFYAVATESVKNMPPVGSEGCYDAVCEFDKYWSGKRAAVSFGVSYDDVERINEKVRLLKAAALAGDAAEFELQREQLIGAIEHAARLERISFESIF